MMILTDDDFELSARFKIRAMGDMLHGDHRRRILRPRGVRGENQTHARRGDRGARRAQDRQAHPAGEVQIQGRVRRGHRKSHPNASPAATGSNASPPASGCVTGRP